MTHAQRERFESHVKVIAGLGAVAAAGAGIAALFGLFWVVGFFVFTLPHGSANLGDLRIETLAPLTAVSAAFTIFWGIVLFGYAGYPFTRLKLAGIRVKYLNNVANRFIVTLGITSCVVLVAIEALPKMPLHFAISPFWIFASPALALTISIAHLVGRYRSRLPVYSVLFCECSSILFWFVTLAISYGLSQIIESERHDTTWWLQLAYVVAFIMLSTFTSSALAQRNLQLTLILGLFTVGEFVAQAPHFAFGLPFQLIGISNYSVVVYPDEADKHVLQDSVARCPGSIRPVGDGYLLGIIASLGDQYIVRCGSDGWIAITRSANWLLSAPPSSSAGKSNS